MQLNHEALIETTSGHAQFSIEMLVILLVIASFVVVAVKHIKIPYTVALVLVGLALGFFNALQPIPLTEHLVLFILLPALLFEASWNLNLSNLKSYKLHVVIFATIGVALSILIIGFCLNFFLHIPWLVALLFGAIIAPTDPVSVVAIMKKVHIDHKISSLVEAESLFNDGTSVVFFKLILALIINFGLTVPQENLAAYLSSGFVQFLIVVLGGVALGSAIGLCFSVITKFFDDHLLELTFTTIVAYGSFMLAELIPVPGQIEGLHLSGVVATVSAGLVMGNYGRHTGMSSSTKIIISGFWEYAAFFMNSLIFLLIGLEIQISSLLNHWIPVSIGVLAVLLSRILSVYFLSGAMNLTKLTNIPKSWQHVLVLSGLKGALSMALVLSIPRELLDEETRELMIHMIFGVVLFTLIPQGLSIAKMLKLLNIGEVLSPELNKHQFFKAKLQAAKSALETLYIFQNRGEVMTPVAKELREELEEEISDLNSSLEDLHISNELILLEDTIETRTQLLKHKKAIVNDLASKGALSNEMALELKADFDDQIEKIQKSY